MSNPVDVTLPCYQWYQFRFNGVWSQKHEKSWSSEWCYPRGLTIWLHRHMQGKWAIYPPHSDVVLFIEDAKDAVLYKLTWSNI